MTVHAIATKASTHSICGRKITGPMMPGGRLQVSFAWRLVNCEDCLLPKKDVALLSSWTIEDGKVTR